MKLMISLIMSYLCEMMQVEVNEVQVTIMKMRMKTEVVLTVIMNRNYVQIGIYCRYEITIDFEECRIISPVIGLIDVQNKSELFPPLL